jgi:NDP-sugar pyrophosphorylase family protein
MNNTEIGEGSYLSYAILDKNTKVGRKCKLGIGEVISNIETPHLLSNGLTVLGKYVQVPDNFHVGKNCFIYPNVQESDYMNKIIQSGETIKPKSKKKIKIR